MSIALDHRQIADEMEIYFLSENVGAGLPVWLPNGVAIRDELEAFIKDLERRSGYQRVVSPHLAKEELYERSGHLRFYKDDMFPPMESPEGSQRFYLKPMNCPHHHMVFASGLRSYRQLPFRLAEYGQVYRHEPSGSLKGLSRVRGLCQNDAHIYIAPEQALPEIRSVLRLHEMSYKALGLSGYRYRLSKHDPSRPEDFQGDAKLWEECENILRQALLLEGLPCFEAEGEAAFYGPKIDVQMRFANEQEESMASVQLDFLSSERFDLSYIASSGASRRPWIVHRAPLGSHERFVAILLEQSQGRLPGWLSPVQALFLPVSDEQIELCHSLASELVEAGVRAKVDLEGGSLAKRIHFAHRSRPFAKIVVGRREEQSGEFEIQFRDGRLKGSRERIVSEIKALGRRPVVKLE